MSEWTVNGGLTLQVPKENWVAQAWRKTLEFQEEAEKLMVQREEAELIIKTPNSLTFIPSLITMELMNVLTLLFQLMFIKHLLSTRHHHVTCFTHVWLHYPMDCSLPGSSVYGTLQARILEWVAIPFSRGSSQPRDWTRVSYVSWNGRQVVYH